MFAFSVRSILREKGTKATISYIKIKLSKAVPLTDREGP
jgi:hypothetical protein